MGFDVTVLTGTKCLNLSLELQEGYNIIRNNSLISILRHAFASDVVISRGSYSLKAGLAALISQTPLVCFYDMMPCVGGFSKLSKLSQKENLKCLISRLAKLHVAVSEAVLENLKLSGRAKACCIYNPVDLDLWTPQPEDFDAREFDVAYVGRLTEGKGLHVLYAALALLDDSQNLRVAIVGSGPEADALKARMSKLRASVSFLGELKGDALRQVYSSSRLIVVPSLAAEGMGMTAAEAMGSGTPVCASAQPALVEVVGPAGFVHQPGDAKTLASHISILLNDRAKWRKMKQKAIERRELFSFHIYRNALRNSLTPILK